MEEVMEEVAGPGRDKLPGVKNTNRKLSVLVIATLQADFSCTLCKYRESPSETFNLNDLIWGFVQYTE